MKDDRTLPAATDTETAEAASMTATDVAGLSEPAGTSPAGLTADDVADAIRKGIIEGMPSADDIGGHIERAVGDAFPFPSLIQAAIYEGTKAAIEERASSLSADGAAVAEMLQTIAEGISRTNERLDRLEGTLSNLAL